MIDDFRMMHVGLGRKHPLHIEYIHLGVCLGFISDIMTEAILSHPKLHLSKKTALIKALNKVIWIQNDLMAKWHIEDGIEFDQREDLTVEKEGYLHGKKILPDIDEDVGAGAGVCPFTGMKGSAASSPRTVVEQPLHDEVEKLSLKEDKPAESTQTSEAAQTV